MKFLETSRNANPCDTLLRLLLCGEVPERLNGAVSKTVELRKGFRGFESHPLRQKTLRLITEGFLLSQAFWRTAPHLAWGVNWAGANLEYKISRRFWNNHCGCDDRQPLYQR